ncbi:MAG: hydantoinase/oxoprolinase family protein [Legionella sp.]
MAEGYLDIAVENMANAIKKISVQRGYDVRQYVLNCFGGAAGQHACRVADNLGITKILIHHLAGVLSAYGMGLAEVRVLREQAIEMPLQREIISFLRPKFAKMEQNARAELKSQEFLSRKIRRTQKVHLRYEGSDTMLPVAFGTMKSMRQLFVEHHRKTFGFASPKKSLVIEAISIECFVPG